MMVDAELWAALERCGDVRLRMRAGRRGKPIATIRLYTRSGERWAIVYRRRRRGESVAALCWRALTELQRRVLQGMPGPDPEARRRRELRRLLDRPVNSRPM